MPRLRVVVTNQDDRKEALRKAERARCHLLETLNVGVDPQHPLRGIHRLLGGRAYFEFAGPPPTVDEVRETLEALEFHDQLAVTVVDEPLGEECVNCGNISGPVLPTKCPNCGFHDIGLCPYEEVPNRDIPRQQYENVAGDLYRVPGTTYYVRLRFNDPMFNSNGTYNQPLVVVERAEGDANV